MLWDEAVASSIYVLNRSVSSKNKSATPYEPWFWHKPNVSNLHIFGQEAVLYNQNYKNKMDARGVEAQFVGYTKRFNSFRFYDGKKISCSCDVKFVNEGPVWGQMGGKQDSSQTESAVIIPSGTSKRVRESTLNDDDVSVVEDDTNNQQNSVFDESSSEDSAAYDSNTVGVAGQNDLLPKPSTSSKKSLAQMIKFNLSKLGPLKDKRTEKTLELSQPCAHRTRISTNYDRRLTLQNLDPGDCQQDSFGNSEDYQLMAMSASVLDDPQTYQEVLSRPDGSF